MAACGVNGCPQQAIGPYYSDGEPDHDPMCQDHADLSRARTMATLSGPTTSAGIMARKTARRIRQRALGAGIPVPQEMT